MSNFERHLSGLREIKQDGYTLKPDGTKDRTEYSWPLQLIDRTLGQIIAIEKEISALQHEPLPERNGIEPATLTEIQAALAELSELLKDQNLQANHAKLMTKKVELERLIGQKSVLIKSLEDKMAGLLSDLVQLAEFENTLTKIANISVGKLEGMPSDSAVPMRPLLFVDKEKTNEAN